MGLFENLSDEEVRLLKTDPRAWASTFLSHPDDPERNYDFRTTDGETKLNYLLHDDGPMNPDNWANINIIKFARGGLKTTATTMLATWAMHMHPTTNIYMAAPRSGQVREFSERLNDKARDSGLSRRQEGENGVNNIERKVYEIATAGDHGENIYKAKFQADSGWEEDSLRGPHSHIGILDEFQDFSRGSFETFMPAIDRELPNVDWAPCVFIIGTPKLEGSFYETLWKQTDQREWDQSSLTWNITDNRDEFKPSQDLLDEMGFDEEDVDGYEVAGWHLDQYNSPLHTPQQIARDKASMREKKFRNEVEARFYSVEDDLLSRNDVTEFFLDDEKEFQERRQSEDSIVTMGVDWGGGHDKNAAVTAIMIVEWEQFQDGDDQGTVLKVDTLDPSKNHKDELMDVEDYIDQYSVDTCVVDHGYGHTSMVDLQDGNSPVDPSGYQDTVVGAKYGNVQNASDIKYEKSSGKRRFFTCEKTYSIERAVEAVRNSTVICPSKDLNFDGKDTLGTRLIDHLTSPYKDHKETPSGTKKIRVTTDSNDNDDIMDSLCFNILAKQQVNKSTTVPIVASSDRF